MSTAFQPNAFQPDAFQIAGGVAAGAITVNIGGTQDGDTGLLVLKNAQLTGVPGGRQQRYVIYINGQRFVGRQEEIYAILEQLAEADAQTVIEGKKAPKRRIIVQPGRQAKQPIAENSSQAIVLHDFKTIQEDFRRVYLAQLAHELLELEQDDEDILLLL